MIDLHYAPTPNGWKITIMLEECGLPYTVVPMQLGRGDQHQPDFLKLSPNGRMPAIVDHAPADGGANITMFESGAILVYLAEKTGKLLPADPAARYEAIQWVMWQMGGMGPMFGQLGFFTKFAGKDIEDPRPRERYAAEARRLLGVLDGQLKGRAWILGADYSLVDIATFPWIRALLEVYQVADLVGFHDFPEVRRALDAFLARPAVQRGLLIPAAP